MQSNGLYRTDNSEQQDAPSILEGPASGLTLHPKAQRTSAWKFVPPWSLLVLAVFLCFAALAIWCETTPRFENGVLQEPDQAPRAVEMPFFREEKVPVGIHLFRYRLVLPRWYPTRYRFNAQGWIHALTINGTRVPVREKTYGWCEYGETMNLAPCLHSGANNFDLEVQNYTQGAALWVDVAAADPCRSIPTALFLLAFTTAMLAFVSLIPTSNWRNTAAGVCWAGGVLRLIYCSTTAPFTRCYDFEGHTQFIDYLLQHCSLPPRHLGWETWQPPFYYCGGALMTKLVIACGGTRLDQFHVLQVGALTISLAVLGISCWLAALCHPGQETCSQKTRILLAISFLPGVVFYASRISNDVLFSIISFLWLGCLLSFWKTGKTKWVYATAITLAFGLITKGSTLLLLAATIAIFFLQPSHPLFWKLKTGFRAALLLALLAAPYQIYAAKQEKSLSTVIVSNIHSLPGVFKFKRNFLNLITFDPIEVVEHPYSSLDANSSRRDVFPEFYFKSAFFGKSRLPLRFELVTWSVIVTAVLLVPFLAFGVYKSIHDRTTIDIPMIIVAFTVIAGQAAWVWREPYVCDQDFRFFVVTTAPLIYLIGRGIDSSIKLFRHFGNALINLQALYSSILLLILCCS